MIQLEEIKKELREAIKYSGKKQKEIAQALGVTQQTISYYLNGQKLPTLDTFANLCKILDLDANEILCLNTPREPQGAKIYHNAGIHNGDVKF